MNLRILVVDDEKVNRTILAQRLNAAGHLAEAHDSARSALQAIDNGTWDVVLTDLCMPETDGMEFMKEIKARSPETSVIIMTAFGNVKSAVDAMQGGAADYLTKPFSFDELKVRLENLAANRAMRQEVVVLRKSVGPQLEYCGMVGASPQMRRIFELVERFADNPSNILIEGETGTGKEQVARALHARSSNAKGPFVALGCANVPRELVESELFGHEAGAFTGATRRRKGRVEMAHGGTLFLDDVDDMPIEMQGKVLRVIQEHQFERVGGEQTLSSECRIIAASKTSLQGLVQQGKFRDDLMYRLRVLVLPIAALRERREDILLLAKHFLNALATQRNTTPKTLSSGCCETLLAHSWPGNVRELQHAMEFAVAMSTGNEIQPADLPPNLHPVGNSGAVANLNHLNLDVADRIDMREQMDKFEQGLLQWALKKANGHQGKAAELLGIPRTTLQSKLKTVDRTAEKPAHEAENAGSFAETPALVGAEI
ncbi:MAG TPA: sigma-54 dependent transcriptional regulator [Planctomycetota bacterium]|nr:sigma-54 dependent transcriptional regulator [Planctomycetota bacterium]